MSRSVATLERRELEALALLASGMTSAAVARRLHVSDRTLRRRLRALYVRLEVHTSIEAVAVATRRGLI